MRAIALGLASFFLAAAAVRFILGFALADRLDAFARVEMVAADPRADVVFIGTRHVKWGINPDAFDHRMAALGTEVRSYNIGESGLSLLESPEHIRKLFDLRPCCIKYVFVEPDCVGVYIVREPNTLRAIEFFSAANAYGAVKFMNSPSAELPPAMPPTTYVSNIVSAAGRHYSNLGLARTNPDVGENSVAGVRGYDIDRPYVLGTYAPTEQQREQYKLRLDYMAERPDAPQLVSDYQVSIVLSLASYVSSKGAHLILLIPPQPTFSEYEKAIVAKVRLLCNESGPALLDFGNPKTYPALFDPLNRADEDHLNLLGANIFSALVADRFAAGLGDGSIAREPCRSS
jgi:hypothetical protein